MELILKLLEKLRGLLELQKNLTRAVFEDHIEPIYSMVGKVTNDYLRLFEQMRNQLADDSISLLIILKKRVNRRKKLELVRKGLAKCSNSLYDFSGDQIEEFACLCKRLIIFHPICGWTSDSIGRAKATSLIDIIERAINSNDPGIRNKLLQRVNRCIKDTKMIWSDITDLYILLKRKMLK